MQCICIKTNSCSVYGNQADRAAGIGKTDNGKRGVRLTTTQQDVAMED